MPLPNFQSFFGPFLNAIKDGDTHAFIEIKRLVIEQLNLSETDLKEKLPSGKQTVFENRIGWARTYLKKAGLIESPERAKFVLTDEGKKALPDAAIIDNSYLSKYPSFRAFQNIDENVGVDNIEEPDNEKSPEELLEDAYEKLNASLADELMTEIMKLEPTAFERLVVNLLLKMGYGNDIEDKDAGLVTKPSNDGGIDGIIKEDFLGFSLIYIQAKRWEPKTSIQRPEIQKFAGALHERNARKGLFISTASFSEGAKQTAQKFGIVLVDGKQLTKLMIKFNLGVSTEHSYEVKRIDSDFFGDGS